MKKFYVYAWSYNTDLVGEHGEIEQNSVYRFLKMYENVNDKDEAINLASKENNIEITKLVAVEKK